MKTTGKWMNQVLLMGCLSALPLSIVTVAILGASGNAQAQMRPPGDQNPPMPPPPPVCPPPQNHYVNDNGSFYLFGSTGPDGQSGSDGLDGRTPSERQVTASGAPVSIDARGGNASNGTEGRDGYEASNCFANQPNNNLQGANGGSGGPAGRGGDAGSGGRTSIYYTGEAQLKQIFIDASPGVPGLAGRYGGRGNRGCGCSYGSWQTRDYRGVQYNNGLICQEPFITTHYCRPGQNGNDAGSARDGQAGRFGRVTLIKSSQHLPANVLAQSVDLASAPTSAVTLQKNIFSQASGAHALLAPNSQVDDSYTRFVTTRLLPIRLIWKARKAITEFAHIPITYELNEDATGADFSTAAWTTGSAVVESGVQIFTIDQAVRAEDAARLTATVTGNGLETKLVFTDAADVSDLVSTQVTAAKLESKGVFSHVRFEGPIPSDKIIRSGNTLSINIGRLWSAGDVSNDLKPGKEINAFLTIQRTMGVHSTELPIEMRKVRIN
jgi:hypothetical protein